MKVAIIGRSSEISKSIAGVLVLQNYEVALFDRRNSLHSFELSKQDYSQISKYDLVIFVAHDHKLNKKYQDLIYQNFSNTLNSIYTAGQKCLYISSLSASKSNRSNYSKQKLGIESLFEKYNYKIIRLGLVTNGQSSAEKMNAFKNIARLANIPLVYFCKSSENPFYTTELESIKSWFLKYNPNEYRYHISLYDEQYSSPQQFLKSIRVKDFKLLPLSLKLVADIVYQLRLHNRILLFDKLLNLSDGMTVLNTNKSGVIE